MQKPVPLCPECHSEATSEICDNLCNLWTVAAGFSAVRAVEYPFYDGNGNITDWKDADGTLVAHHEYDPYGNETTGNPPASFGFSTKSFDPTLNLYYYGYRFYRPDWGRWMNRDPIGERDVLNLYSFVQNNSFLWVDPFGDSLSRSQCESAVNSALNNNAKGRSLMAALNEENCPIPDVTCDCCPTDSDGNPTMGGQFNPSTKDILVCLNGNHTSGGAISTVVHELVHAYDDCKGTDWNNCEDRACSEIRAYDHAGTCRPGGAHRENGESYRDCIKRNAAASVGADTNCVDAAAIVSAVFERCFSSTVP